MEFQKIKKEDWEKLTQSERDLLNLKFQESIESRKKWTLIITRTLALIFIGVLFFIGYAQLESVRNYNKNLDEYGTMGFCSLCGEYNLKKCECVYNEEYYKQVDRENVSKYLSEYNRQSCGFKELYDDNPIEINWSELKAE